MKSVYTFILSFLYLQIANGQANVPIGQYSRGEVFTRETLNLFDSSRFEYMTGTCQDRMYGKGHYSIKDSLLVLSFEKEEFDFDSLVIRKVKCSSDSLFICIYDKFKRFKSVEFTYKDVNGGVFDTAISALNGSYFSVARRSLPIAIEFRNLELLLCDLTFSEPGIFNIEVATPTSTVLKKMKFSTRVDGNASYRFTISDEGKLILSDLQSGHKIVLYRR